MAKKTTPFRLFYESLPGNLKSVFFTTVTDECGISSRSFYRHLDFPDKIRKPAREEINKIASSLTGNVENLFINK
jgi:hypothetical protein